MLILSALGLMLGVAVLGLFLKALMDFFFHGPEILALAILLVTGFLICLSVVHCEQTGCGRGQTYEVTK